MLCYHKSNIVSIFVEQIKINQMISINPQYIKDTAGKQLVVLPAKEFNTIMEELEDLEDIKRYDAAKKRKQSFVDADTAFKQIEAKRKKHV
jgi:PHD/YefM family antitoxin component YafN of YafNO toxin-antitoxin module